MSRLKGICEAAGSFRVILRAVGPPACAILIAFTCLQGGSPEAGASNQKRKPRPSASRRQPAPRVETRPQSIDPSRKKAPPVPLPAALVEGQQSNDDPNGRRE